MVSLMVGTVVDNSDCGSSRTSIDDNVTTTSPDTESEGFTEVELCEIRVAAAVTLMAGIFQVIMVKRNHFNHPKWIEHSFSVENFTHTIYNHCISHLKHQ